MSADNYPIKTLLLLVYVASDLIYKNIGLFYFISLSVINTISWEKYNISCRVQNRDLF
jgi:hypothetical protein